MAPTLKLIRSICPIVWIKSFHTTYKDIILIHLLQESQRPGWHKEWYMCYPALCGPFYTKKGHKRCPFSHVTHLSVWPFYICEQCDFSDVYKYWGSGDCRPFWRKTESSIEGAHIFGPCFLYMYLYILFLFWYILFSFFWQICKDYENKTNS